MTRVMFKYALRHGYQQIDAPKSVEPRAVGYQPDVGLVLWADHEVGLQDDREPLHICVAFTGEPVQDHRYYLGTAMSPDIGLGHIVFHVLEVDPHEDPEGL